MALSEQVESSLRDAQGHLRNALSFAARSEKPYISKHIADMLMNVDNLIDADEVLTMFEERFRHGKDMDAM
tara:strand:- start:8 stop:220 length:213 start_codon:yes stop_codon:yes gene_type:complete